MRVTVAHMGRFADMMKPFLEDLGLAPIMAPRPSRRTLERGIALSPEYACLPLKLNIGTFMDAADAGADTILMAGGLGPCRFGYYAEIQREALAKAGYAMQMVVLEPPKGRLLALAKTVRNLLPDASLARIARAYRLALRRIDATDALESRAMGLACRDELPGTSLRIMDRGLREICSCHSWWELQGCMARAMGELDAVARGTHRHCPRVAVVGEIYSLLEPFVNMDIYRRLTLLGVEVVPTVTLSDWVRQNLTLNPLRRSASRRKLLGNAKGYLHHWVGGEGLETIANTVRLGRPKSPGAVDGVLHVLPFTCMPEIVAESILPTVTRDLGLPCMGIVFDEHSSETGLETRLEAFVDLLGL